MHFQTLSASVLWFVVFAGFPFLTVVWFLFLSCSLLCSFLLVWVVLSLLPFLLVLSLQNFQDFSGPCQDSTLSQVDFISFHQILMSATSTDHHDL